MGPKLRYPAVESHAHAARATHLHISGSTADNAKVHLACIHRCVPIRNSRQQLLWEFSSGSVQCEQGYTRDCARVSRRPPATRFPAHAAKGSADHVTVALGCLSYQHIQKQSVCACAQGRGAEIALAGSRHLCPTHAAAPMLFAHTAVIATQKKDSPP